MTYNERTILKKIGEFGDNGAHGPTITMLLGETETERNAVTTALTNLADNGFVTIQETLITITPEGKDALDE